MSVAGIAAGHDAVEKVDSARNTLENISRSADAHEIARLIGGHIRLNSRNYAVHILFRLADGKSAYGVAVEIESGYTLHMLYTQVIKGAALIYAEEQLIFIYRIGQRIEAFHLRLAALKPTRRACAGLLGILIFAGFSTHSSNAIAIVEPRFDWILMLSSGPIKSCVRRYARRNRRPLLLSCGALRAKRPEIRRCP